MTMIELVCGIVEDGRRCERPLNRCRQHEDEREARRQAVIDSVTEKKEEPCPCGGTGFLQWQIGEIFPCNCTDSSAEKERERLSKLCPATWPSDQTERCEWPKDHNGLHRTTIQYGYNKGKQKVWGIDA